MRQLLLAFGMFVGLAAMASHAADDPARTPAPVPVATTPAEAADKNAAGCMPGGACCGGGACAKAAASQPESGATGGGCPCKRGRQEAPPKAAQ
jgi:hypothetical protein